MNLRSPSLLHTAGLALMLLCLSLPSAAETLYVVDRLQVGIHEEASVDSAIVKVIPTGTALELVRREGDLIQVRDTDGAVGWVDGAYLTGELPAGGDAEPLAQRIVELEQRLEAAQSTIAELQAAGTGEGGSETLRREIEQLKQQVASERLRAGELQARLSELQRRVQAGEEDEADPRVDELRAALAEAEGRLSRQSQQDLLDPATLGWVGQRPWIVLLVLLIAFGAGVYLMDLLHRRRHGGFRI